MIIKYILGIAVALTVMSFTGCAGKGSSASAAASVEDSDSLPQAVKKLVRSVENSDTAEFASMMDYPVARPYPLPDVDNRENMEKYYPVLVDDSLRHVITNSKPADWHEYGWRGWALADGQYLWIDDKSVYSVNYVSQKELQMKDSLSKLEIASLAPGLQKGEWTPVACLRQADGPAVFRIDLSKGKQNAPAYRMLEYASAAEMRKQPVRVFTGYLESQGTAMIACYHFTAPDGTKAEYMADVSDNSTPAIDMTLPDGKGVSIEVKPSYWLNLLPPTPAK